MKYRELIQFNPIESIIVLTDANDKGKAAALVKSYVMSDDMADKLKAIMLSQLQLTDVVDNKGLFLVGNYGTGKSHLMSVISAIANDEANLALLQNRKFAEDAKCVAGKFEVLRIEIGSSTMPLRKIILSKVQEDFKARGLAFKFPEASEIVNNRDTLNEMMAIFASKYVGKGYLIVVDELLDYLSGRKDQELRIDLGFLRELGEIVKSSRLRVIFGVQEKVFDNPSFSFVSNALSRIKDRYREITIQKNDTQYVVSQRILQKTTEQKAKIRKHLQKFCSLYSNMSERIEEYVELFPIHPSFVEVFNKLLFRENRHILADITELIRRNLDETVDDSAPAIISFDSYWSFIRDNLALSKTNPNISETVEKSGILEDIVQRSFPKKAYKTLAIKIIHALSIHRLTTVDTSIAAGMTSENLRDDLCLYITGMPDQSSATLLSLVQTTLKEIMTTVSGQFIDYKQENGQYYIDVKKDIDYDAKITQLAATISDDKLNAPYFSIIQYFMRDNVAEKLAGTQIWDYELQWVSHNIFRRGYLFLGTPEWRPTAQPPEDFYIYFIPPFGNTLVDGIDAKKEDEVFFMLRQDSEEFKNNLRLYAAALLQREMADEKNKGAYQGKADGYKKKLLQYLSAQLLTSFDVIYKGEKTRLVEILKGKHKDVDPFKDKIDLAASFCFDVYFKSIYPEFPKFKLAITTKNQADILRAGYDRFAGKKTQQSDMVLESLGLLSGENISAKGSVYAGYYTQLMDSLPANSVLNFSDIFVETHDGDHRDKKFGISYAIMPIVFLGLVHAGSAVMKLKSGMEITASNLDQIPKMGMMDLQSIQYLSKPRKMAITDLVRLYEMLGLPAGLIRNPNEQEKGLVQLLAKAQAIAEDASSAVYQLSRTFELWGEPLIPSNLTIAYTAAARFVSDMLGNFQSRYNTVAKLNNFAHSAADLDSLQKGLEIISIVAEYVKFQSEAQHETTYISNLEYIELGAALKAEIEATKAEFRRIRDAIRNDGTKGDAAAHDINQHIKAVKKNYIDFYYAEHTARRLDVSAGKRKGDLISSLELQNLKRLKDIPILSASKLDTIDRDLASLKVCIDLTPASLEKTHQCKCGFQVGGGDAPVRGKMEDLENRVDALTEEWTKKIFDAINDPLVIGNKQFLSAEQKKVIEEFIKTKTLPERVDAHFTDAIKKLLQSYETVEISADEIEERLDALGHCEVETFKQAFVALVDERTRGRDKDKLRIIIKK